MAWEEEPKLSEQDAVIGIAVVGKAVVGFSATLWDFSSETAGTWLPECTAETSSGVAGLAGAGCSIAGSLVGYTDWILEAPLNG